MIQVREGVFREEDGPMLKYGLQALHNSELLLPTRIEDRSLKTDIGTATSEFYLITCRLFPN